MPYSTIAELPSEVRDTYNPNQQAAFLSAFNAAMEADGDEGSAFAIAHTAAQGTKSMWFKSFGDVWIGFYTNAYKDRDGEYFPEAEIERDIARMNATGEYPELQYFHLPWARIGHAQAAIKMGRFGVVTGLWDTTPLARAVKAAVEASPEQYGMSFGFEYAEDNKQDNAFYGFKTFEVTVLPIEYAANSFTQFVAVQQGEKSMNPMGSAEQQVREFLTKAGVVNPDDVIQALKDGAKSATDMADQATSRDFKETVGEVIEAEGQDDLNEIEVESPVRAYIDKRLMEAERKMSEVVKSMFSDYETKFAEMTKPASDMENMAKAMRQMQAEQAAQTMQGARAANLLQEQKDNRESMNAYKELQAQGHDVGFAEFMLGQKFGGQH